MSWIFLCDVWLRCIVHLVNKWNIVPHSCLLGWVSFDEHNSKPTTLLAVKSLECLCESSRKTDRLIYVIHSLGADEGRITRKDVVKEHLFQVFPSAALRSRVLNARRLVQESVYYHVLIRVTLRSS